MEIHSGHQHYLWFLIILLLLIFAGTVLLFQDRPPVSVATTSSKVDTLGRVYTVFYNIGVFSPTILQIRAKDTVRFKNESDKPIVISSDPQSERGNVGELKSKVLERGDVWTFIFLKSGIFGYHNERNPEESGTIVVK